MGTAGCPVLWGHLKLICRDHEVLPSLGQESVCFLVLTRVGLAQRGSSPLPQSVASGPRNAVSGEEVRVPAG